MMRPIIAGMRPSVAGVRPSVAGGSSRGAGYGLAALRALGGLAMLCAVSSPAMGGGCTPQRLNPSVVQAGARFGGGVAIAGDWIAAAAPYEDAPTFIEGAVYMFERQGDGAGPWSQAQRLLRPTEATQAPFFGHAISMGGARMVITGLGAAYVYRLESGQWVFEDELLGVGEVDGFGSSAAIDKTGSRAIVGNPFAGESDSGRAYVYQRTGTQWQRIHTIAPPAPEAGANFGASVAIAGDWFAVGEPKSDASATDGGAFHIYHLGDSGVTLEAVDDPDGVLDGISLTDEVGVSMDMDGRRLVVGARFDELDEVSPGAQAIGAAYVLARDSFGWSIEQKISSASAEFSDNTGISVAIRCRGVVLGSPLYFGAGGAFPFKLQVGAWVEQATLFAPPPPLGFLSRFGDKVAMDGDTVVVGAWSDDAGGTDAGGAFAVCFEPVCGCEGDADGDGDGDFADLNVVLGEFGNLVEEGAIGDLDGDGDVDFDDLNAVLEIFGEFCS